MAGALRRTLGRQRGRPRDLHQPVEILLSGKVPMSRHSHSHVEDFADHTLWRGVRREAILAETRIIGNVLLASRQPV